MGKTPVQNILMFSATYAPCISPTSGGVIAASQTVCYNTAPAAFTSSSLPTDYLGTLEYQWQNSTDNVNFSDIGSATGTTYAAGALTQDTWFRRIARVDCKSWDSAVASNVVKVTIYSTFTSGEIATTGQTICYNGDPSVIGNVTSAGGGDNVIAYKWQSSINGTFSDAVDIGSATSTTYDPPTGLTVTTWYRRMAKDGTCSTTFTAATGTWKVTVRPQFTTGAIPATGETICYGGNPVLIGSTTAASGGDGSISYQWQSESGSVDSPPGFNNIPGATDETYDPPAGLTVTTTYRRMAKEGTCNIVMTASTGTWTVTVRPQFTTGLIASTGETICYGGNPGIISSTTPASGGNGSISYQWQKLGAAVDVAIFTDIPGATDATYDPPNGLTTTTTYRRMAKDGACNTTFTASAGSWVVSVRPQFTAGTILTTGETICYNGDPAIISNSALATGGDGTISYQWQIQATTFDGALYDDISGATNASYDPPAGLSATTTYRRTAKDGTCNAFTPSTGTWTVTVRPVFTSGTIASTGETICYGEDPSLIGSTAVASGGDGTIAYQWQYLTAAFDNVSYTDIPGATNATYDPPSGLTASTTYRRTAKDGTCNTTFTESSGTWIVTVRQQFTTGAIETTGETICYSGNPGVIGSSTSASGGDGVISYQWQKSITDASNNFSDIGSATGTTYDPPSGLSVTTWYRRLAKDGTCNTTLTASTGTWLVTVHPLFTPGAIVTTGETICYSGNPVLIGSTTAASGGDGSISYQWQRESGAVDSPPGFIDIPGATDETYDPPAGLTATTTYRRTAKDATCNTTFSAATGTWTVTVRPQFTTGAIAATGQTICYSGDPGVIGNVTAASGGDGSISYQWQSGTTDALGNFSDIGSATGTTYDPPSGLTVTTWYRRMAKDGTCNTTFTAATGTWQVIVRPQFTTGAILTTGETICYGGDLAIIGNSTVASGGDAVISYKWQKSSTVTDNAEYSDISGATDSYYDPPSGLTITTVYRRMAKDGTCNATFTASTGTWTVLVRPQFTTGSILTTGETICFNGDPGNIGNSAVSSGGDNVISYQWQKSTAGSSSGFGDISGATGSSFDPPTGLTVTTWYRRTASDGTCNTTYSASTGVWQVVVNPATVAGSVTGGAQVCYGTNSTLLTLSGHVGTVQYWQYSTDGSSWTTIPGTTATTYTAVNLTTATWYRANVISGVCSGQNSTATQITVFSDFHVSGYAKYYNNPLTPLDGLKITLKKNGVTQGTPVVTGATGYYNFGGLVNGVYNIEVSSAHPTGTWQTWGGVNNTDYLLVAKHAAGIQLLPDSPPVVRIAGSVKLPHPVINTLDADAIKKASVLGWGNPAYFDIPKWVFSGVNKEARIDTFQVSCANLTRDIRGLCAGDVNGTNIPSGGFKQTGPNLQLVNLGTLPVTRELIFPVTSERNMELGAITLLFDFNPALIEITGVEMPENGGEEPWFSIQSSTNTGPEPLNLEHSTLNTLQIGWMSLNPVNVVAGQAVLVIHARLVSSPTSLIPDPATHIHFSLNANPLSELADADGNVLYGLKLSIPDAGSTPILHCTVITVYPNPASHMIHIDYLMNRDGNFKAEFVTMQGVVAKKVTIGSTAGLNSAVMDIQDYPNGVYMLRMTFGEETVLRKVVINR